MDGRQSTQGDPFGSAYRVASASWAGLRGAAVSLLLILIAALIVNPADLWALGWASIAIWALVFMLIYVAMTGGLFVLDWAFDAFRPQWWQSFAPYLIIGLVLILGSWARALAGGQANDNWLFAPGWALASLLYVRRLRARPGLLSRKAAVRQG